MSTNPVNYFEIGTPDPEAAQVFYTGLFDWELGPASPARYRMINTDQGGMWDTSSMGGARWSIFYVQVEDVAAAVEKAQSLGATVAIPLTSNPRIEFAHLVDPQGNRFGVWRPKD